MELFNHYVEDKIAAEEAGFDWVGCNEHHMSPYGLMPNPNLVGAVIANRTTRVGILQSGVIVPLVSDIPLVSRFSCGRSHGHGHRKYQHANELAR